MIQRIQTIYLVLGAAALVAMLFFDSLWTSRAVETYAWFGPGLLILGGLTAATALAAIFLYKDRKRQRTVVRLVQVGTLLLAAFLYISLYTTSELVVLTERADPVAFIPILLPILAYLLFYLARRGVERDIELVRSMDRLR